MGVPQAERVATIQPFPLKEFKETLEGMGVWVGEGVGGCGRVWVVWMGGCGRVWEGVGGKACNNLLKEWCCV